MTTYLVNFIVYSMAMVGLLFLCLLIYKKTMVNGKCTKNNKELIVENALNLSTRKTLYVIRAGEEKFLIAGDTERTTFLAKLNNTEHIQEKTKEIPVQFIDTIAEMQNNKPVDYSEINTYRKVNKQPVMKEVLRKLEEYSTSKQQD